MKEAEERNNQAAHQSLFRFVDKTLRQTKKWSST